MLYCTLFRGERGAGEDIAGFVVSAAAIEAACPSASTSRRQVYKFFIFYRASPISQPSVIGRSLYLQLKGRGVWRSLNGIVSQSLRLPTHGKVYLVMGIGIG